MSRRSQRTASRARGQPATSSQPADAPPPQEIPLERSPLLHLPRAGLQAQLRELLPRKIEPNRYMHIPTLENLGIMRDVEYYLNRSNLRTVFEMNEPTYRDLTLEFYTTFELDRSFNDWDSENVIKFRLGRQSFSMSLDAFGIALGVLPDNFVSSGMREEAIIDFPPGTPDWGFWQQVCINTPEHQTYNSSRTKSTSLRTHIFRYLHRVIVHTLTSRHESTGVVQQRDLFYLYCMVEGYPCHLGLSLAYYFRDRRGRRNGALSGGPYITRLAKNLGVFDQWRDTLHFECHMSPINRAMLVNMHLITRHEGRLVFVAGDQFVEMIQPQQTETEAESSASAARRPRTAGPSMGATSRPAIPSLETRLERLETEMGTMRQLQDQMAEQQDRLTRLADWQADMISSMMQQSGHTIPYPRPPAFRPPTDQDPPADT